MTRMVIWDVPTFCRFYGRVIPYNSKEGKFNEFTASKMEEDVDTHITFDKSLEPMTFMNMLALSRSLFVVGYGKAEDCWGKTYFERYTVYDEQGLRKYLGRFAINRSDAYEKFEIDEIVKTLKDWGQTALNIIVEYSNPEEHL
jgi:hypothetical protein